MGEVCGALQTKMVDLVQSTAVAFLAFQWHTTDLAYMTEETSGVLIGAWLMNERAFDALQPEYQELLMKLARADSDGNRLRTRDADRQSYQRLIARGYEVSKLTPEGKTRMDQIHEQVRKRMVGRIYSAELLARIQAIAAKHR